MLFENMNDFASNAFWKLVRYKPFDCCLYFQGHCLICTINHFRYLTCNLVSNL